MSTHLHPKLSFLCECTAVISSKITEEEGLCGECLRGRLMEYRDKVEQEFSSNQIKGIATNSDFPIPFSLQSDVIDL